MASAFPWSSDPGPEYARPSGGMCGVRGEIGDGVIWPKCVEDFGCSGFLYEIGAVGEAAEFFLHFLGKD